MGVTCLVRWKNATGMRDFTYIAEHVTKTLHGKNTGPWSLSFKVFRDINSQGMQQQQAPPPTPSSTTTTTNTTTTTTTSSSQPTPASSSQPPPSLKSQPASSHAYTKESKLLYQVSLAQQPKHVYCMVEGSVVIEAEKELELILLRLKNLWQLRQSVTIEGTSYDIGDFTLRVANILLGSTYKGLLLEIEYHPCSTPNRTRQLLEEFIASIVPSSAQLSCEYEYNFEQVGLSGHEFTIAHTSYQYMHLFRNDGLF
ncbi:mediator complex, subunit Med20 [Mycotypha africana]|uniref:mediator complex, subunit Med20 n=1 Tax=Mycotypha africana TaxID=64632 RepID=UPI002301ACAF|nr:mediator complex, subunit Med20 [Mycotypha africana]KAI8973604.1 mediator complex, subunit Med20 [Mycotypha africana]